MKDIGESFQTTREEMGVKLQEAASDLGITEAQLENLEDGNINAFKDIFFLKELIIKYTKYLNLKEDEIMETFNDFVFDFTSKIPVTEIEERVKEISKEEKENAPKKIVSPYTSEKNLKTKIKPIYVFFAVLFIMIITSLVIIIVNNKDKEFSTNIIETEEYYELTK